MTGRILLDSSWTYDAEITDLSLAARWQLIATAELVARIGNDDYIVSRRQALRCSDLDDPEAALTELERAGLVDPVKDHPGHIQVYPIRMRILPADVIRFLELD